MSSVFAWVDFAEEDRRRMAQVIDLFQEEETRDELGLGVIRDALADLLFPGTSTIQTRARYFLFVPWIYLRHETRATSGADVARKARADEDKLIVALVQGGERPIGAEKRAALQRPASSVYWAGLAKWRIRRFRGSQEQYHRAWTSLMQRSREAAPDDDEEPGDAATVAWDPEIPEAPADFLKVSSFSLLRPEAEYLQQRILGLGPTLLGHLVGKTKPAEDAQFAWTHPEASAFPERLGHQLEHARLFSEAMHGAALLYNLMLAERRKNAKWIDTYRTQFNSWSELLLGHAETFSAWDRADFWSLAEYARARVTFRTRRFVNDWLDLALTASKPRNLADDTRALTLVGERERELKRSRARLGNPRALERWTGAAGVQPLNYRWPRVRVIVGDILKGLEG
ncbi:MAG: hypothetical protein FJ207_15090 [Gemmatimonadetes bacterium]|nr:hypothetical protein [Gemmatimonadota bacterium]